jgi:hypothetical protein
LKEPVQQRAAPRQTRKRRGQSIERLVGFVVMILNPPLYLLHTSVDESASLVQRGRVELFAGCAFQRVNHEL